MAINLGGFLIGKDHPPFVIAEMSGNHNQSLDRALAIVAAAAAAGAHAIKLQTYTADTMTLDVEGGDFEISDPSSPWCGRNLHKLFKEAYTPWSWHQPIIDHAKSLGLICFSTPFDESAVDFLETLNVPAYKIASFENNHLPLIEKVASTGKPLILSTGMASPGELYDAVRVARQSGCNDLVLLKCTSTYPASPEASNLRTIPHLREFLGCEVGLSDHTLGIGVPLAGVALGATVIEKHFTLSRAEGGVDSAFSLNPDEFSLLVEEATRAWQSLGAVSYGPTESEKDSSSFRRSIYASADISPGDIFSSDNIRVIRPGLGASPSLYPTLIGRTSRQEFKKGDPIRLSDLL